MYVRCLPTSGRDGFGLVAGGEGLREPNSLPSDIPFCGSGVFCAGERKGAYFQVVELDDFHNNYVSLCTWSTVL